MQPGKEVTKVPRGRCPRAAGTQHYQSNPAVRPTREGNTHCPELKEHPLGLPPGSGLKG